MTPEKPAWAAKVEAMKNARYVGLYDLPDREGPFYVFWQDEIPEEFRGDERYDNYFGLIWRGETPYITSARSIRDAVFSAYEYTPGQFICSRYRHDFVAAPQDEGALGREFLDGGLAYVRGSVLPTHTMRVVDGVEVFEPRAEEPK